MPAPDRAGPERFIGDTQEIDQFQRGGPHDQTLHPTPVPGRERGQIDEVEQVAKQVPEVVDADEHAPKFAPCGRSVSRQRVKRTRRSVNGPGWWRRKSPANAGLFQQGRNTDQNTIF